MLHSASFLSAIPIKKNGFIKKRRLIIPWETRKGYLKYYTRKHRIGDEVITEYIGTGEAAILIAILDALEKQIAELEELKKTQRDHE